MDAGIHAGRLPGLHLIIAGTRMFYDGRQGVQTVDELRQRVERLVRTSVRPAARSSSSRNRPGWPVSSAPSRSPSPAATVATAR